MVHTYLNSRQFSLSLTHFFTLIIVPIKMILANPITAIALRTESIQVLVISYGWGKPEQALLSVTQNHPAASQNFLLCL